MEQTIELTPIEKQVDLLLGKSGFYLQTYRAIDALSVLKQARELAEGETVRGPICAVMYRNMGQATFQLGKTEEAMGYFIRSLEALEDDNDRAAAAGVIADYYLQEGKKDEARKYANEALRLAKAPELKAHPYQIMGGIAIEDGDYPKGLELMNKAAEKAEQAHCLTELAMIIMDISVIFFEDGSVGDSIE